MNTGLTLETERLFLIPGSNARDDELFIQMLRKDGNFRDFCGIEFSEKYLENFLRFADTMSDNTIANMLNSVFRINITRSVFLELEKSKLC